MISFFALYACQKSTITINYKSIREQSFGANECVRNQTPKKNFYRVCSLKGASRGQSSRHDTGIPKNLYDIFLRHDSLCYSFGFVSTVLSWFLCMLPMFMQRTSATQSLLEKAMCKVSIFIWCKCLTISLFVLF